MTKRLALALLGAILLLFAVISTVGITWGLPSRTIDKYLFGDDQPWSGERIYRLAGAAGKLAPEQAARRGADVDVDPLDRSSDEPILLTGSDEDVAKIYLRYRLYTYQPDEMITMMALAGMNPRKLDLDPRLYQYGGLFIYPVGALIGTCGLLGLIDVRSDVVYYLDNPDEFGKFYVVARGYSAAWGLLGVVVVFLIARRLGGVGKHGLSVENREADHARAALEHGTHALGQGTRSDDARPARTKLSTTSDGSRAGLLAALLFTLMPVVVCMAHEGKPHLPGAVLMLLAVWFAMRHLSRTGGTVKRSLAVENGETDHARAALGHGTRSGEPRRNFWLMCICCGAALGMVLSSWPILVLIPLVAMLESRSRAVPGGRVERSLAVRQTCSGAIAGVLTYLVTNPYILINAFLNRDVLKSNFGNSLAMYEIARVGEGFVRVLELTVEGATLPVVALGVIALAVTMFRRGGTVKRSLAVENRETDHARAALGHGTRRGALPTRIVMLPLAVPAVVFFLQFVLIGAGKPAEYGRFGIFTNTALAIGSACLLTRRWTKLREIVNWVPAMFVAICVAFSGATYLRNFRLDATNNGSRAMLARLLESDWKEASTGRSSMSIAVLAEPAPYNCPPTHLSNMNVVMYASREHVRREHGRMFPSLPLLIEPVDLPGPTEPPDFGRTTGIIDLRNYRQPTWWERLAPVLARPTPISWANKVFRLGSGVAAAYADDQVYPRSSGHR